MELEDGSMVGATPNYLRAQFTSDKVKRLRVKIDKVMKENNFKENNFNF